MVIKKIKNGIKFTRVVIYRETLIDYKEKGWSFLGAFIGLGIISLLQKQSFNSTENLFLIGSFGASCVLVYGAIHSPLAQPRCLVGGHLVSALIGVSIAKLTPDGCWFAPPLAVAFSIIGMQFTRTLHPPGGATSMIAIIGSEKVKSLGYWYVLSPVLSGAVILLLVALVFNNITAHRKYPTHSRLTSPLVMVWRRILKHDN